MCVNKLDNKLNTISLETPVASVEDNCELAYFIADEFNMEQELEIKLTNELLMQFIEELPELNKQIIKLSLKGMTQHQIASYLKLSSSYINTLYNKSINILRIKFSRKGMM